MIDFVEGFSVVQIDNISIGRVTKGVEEFIIVVKELGKAVPPLPETMLLAVEKVVVFKEVNHLGPDNSFKHLDDVRGEGDRPIVGRVILVSFLVDGDNRLHLVGSGYDTLIKGRPEHKS